MEISCTSEEGRVHKTLHQCLRVQRGKGEKCMYCHKGFHSESTCMQKKIDMISQILHQNNLGDLILEGAKKKKPKDLNSKKGNSIHALIVINSSLDAWIVDSEASHHMDASKVVHSLWMHAKVLLF
jgi:hypothetical protein